MRPRERMVVPCMPQPTSGASSTGGFARHQGTFTGRISRDGSSGFLAEAGRYQLYASLACPWSQRVLIVRRLLGLEQVIGLSLTDPIKGERGWRFPDRQGGMDPVTGARFLSELYMVTDPGYQGRCDVPFLWDTQTQRIITNDVSQMTVMLETEFIGYHRPGSPDLYPAAQRREIEAIATLIYHAVNNGVYQAGFATTQAAYEEAFDTLFATMDALDERLSRRRFLLGGQLSEADVRLFPTLARFDAVYYIHFKCNLHRLVDYRHLWGYARDLYQRPGFGDTTDFGQIKRHYYQSQSWINPSRIVPKGPFVSWLESHGRDRLSA
jgi:glutathionyl-hydroquinone reductase